MESLATPPSQRSRLLGSGEPEPAVVYRGEGVSPFLLVCDHAGRLLPGSLGDLGLPPADLERHIAWDIGARGVARGLADRLDAVLVEQTYSRLAIDCNRPPSAPSSIPLVSETTEIPGNRDLDEAARAARVAEVFAPYHAAIEVEIARRDGERMRTVLIAIHSFTPVYKGEARPWHVGTLYGRDARLASTLRAALAADGALVVGDNEPYAVSDETDYTIPVHGERLKLVHVGIEIRQDLIAGPDGQRDWAERLAVALPDALDRVDT